MTGKRADDLFLGRIGPSGQRLGERDVTATRGADYAGRLALAPDGTTYLAWLTDRPSNGDACGELHARVLGHPARLVASCVVLNTE